MASIRQAAQNVLWDAKDGIAWIAMWKSGKSWNTQSFWLDIDSTGNLKFDEDEDLNQIRQIVDMDPNAILVNSYYHNLGDVETMTRDSLAEALRWQYEDVCSYLAIDAISE